MQNSNKVIPGMGLHHPGLTVSNYENSMRFYTEGLGFTVFVEFGEAPHKNALLNAGNGTYIEIMCNPEAEPFRGSIGHFALCVPDCEKAFAHALSIGAKPIYQPQVSVMGANPGVPVKWAYVSGPDGEWIEFCQYDL